MSFYMNFGVINEGEQAEAYKKRKADEAAAKEKSIEDRLSNRYKVQNIDDRTYSIRDDKQTGLKMTKDNPNNSILHPKKKIEGMKKDKEFMQAVKDKTTQTSYNRELGREVRTSKPEWDHGVKNRNASSKNDSRLQNLDATDAIKRHFRRHPEKLKEFGIFAETCFIDD